LEVQVSYPQGAGRQISSHKEIIKSPKIKVTSKLEKCFDLSVVEIEFKNEISIMEMLRHQGSIL
jgi:hypothetical protein